MWCHRSFACLASLAWVLRKQCSQECPGAAWSSPPVFSGCQGTRAGHTLASAHQLHAPTACHACLPVARSCLLSLPVHAPDVCAKLASLGGRGSRLYPGLRSSEQLLVRGSPRLEGGGQEQPPSSLRPLFIGAENRLFSALIMLPPSSCPSCPWTTSLAAPTPCLSPARPRDRP